MSAGAVRIKGSMEDDVVHVRERADNVKQKFRAVGAIHVHDRVTSLPTLLNRHLRSIVRRRWRCRLVVPVRKHQLVQPAFRVDGYFGRGGGCHPCAAAEDVPQQRLDAAEVGVYGGEGDDRGGSSVVGPDMRLTDITAKVGKNSEDLRKEPWPILAGEL